MSLPEIYYALIFVSPSLVRGVTHIIVVCRAKREDLPAIVRALNGRELRDDDKGNISPSLPKP